MSPTPAQQPEDLRAKIESLRAKQKEKEIAELASINAVRATRGELPLTELPQVVESHESGRLRPSRTPLVLRPKPLTGKEAASGRDDAPELVPDPKNPGQYIMKDFLPEE